MIAEQDFTEAVARYRERHKPMTYELVIEFAKLRGCGPDTPDRSHLVAGATNPQAMRIIRKASPEGFERYVAEVGRRVLANPEYYKCLRACYGLDYGDGWFERHVTAVRNAVTDSWGNIVE